MVEHDDIRVFYCVCDECGTRSEWRDDRQIVMDEASFDGWEIVEEDGVLVKCLCSACAFKAEEANDPLIYNDSWVEDPEMGSRG